MAHLRPGTVLTGNNKIGNYVETKKVVMGEGSQASHLTYLGDAEVGRNVNFGCGTITCNYDGVNKYKTTIEDDVILWGQVAVNKDLTIGKGAVLLGTSAIDKSIEGNKVYFGAPAMEARKKWQELALIRRLPKMYEQLNKLTKDA